nr:hypothetical protein CFP56_09025 [Quercus suber]
MRYEWFALPKGLLDVAGLTDYIKQSRLADADGTPTWVWTMTSRLSGQGAEHDGREERDDYRKGVNIGIAIDSRATGLLESLNAKISQAISPPYALEICPFHW